MFYFTYKGRIANDIIDTTDGKIDTVNSVKKYMFTDHYKKNIKGIIWYNVVNNECIFESQKN